MASVTIRIPPSAHTRAQRLAKKESTTLGAVIDAALERYERERMLAAYAEDMERLWTDPDARAHYQAEVALWDQTAADGLAEYPYEEVEVPSSGDVSK
jgi:predicted transcriptional regulator